MAEAQRRRLVAFGLAAAAAAALAGAADWSEQHEQQMRVGVVHAAANVTAAGFYGASLLTRKPAASRALRLAGLAAVTAGSLLGGHISFRLSGGANQAEPVPHLVEPGWHDLMPAAGLGDGEPVRAMLGEVPVVVIRDGRAVHVLAGRCSHLSGPLSEGDLDAGVPDLPLARQRLPDHGRGRGPRARDRAAAGAAHPGPRRHHPGLPAGRGLTGPPGGQRGVSGLGGRLIRGLRVGLGRAPDPEKAMTLPASQQHALNAIDDVLQSAEPRLATMFGVFTDLTRMEAMPAAETLPPGRVGLDPVPAAGHLARRSRARRFQAGLDGRKRPLARRQAGGGLAASSAGSC